jgi:tetratricopeptide (TPR) repeat protein
MIYPNRNQNHALESASVRYVKYHLPKEWLFTKPSEDYGVDLVCEVVIDNEIRGYEFGIQLKSKKTEKNKENIFVKGLKRSSINYWLNSVKPIMLIAFVEDEEQAYWSWIKQSSFDLTKPNNEFQLKISKKNILTSTSSEIIGNYIRDYNLKMLELKNLPNIKEDFGWELYLKKKYEESLPYLKKMSKSIDILNAISICYYRSFRYKNALIYANEGLDIESDNVTLLSNKASILIEFGGTQKDDNLIIEGLKIIDLLIDRAKLSNDTYYNYGTGLMALGNYEYAKDVFKSVLKTNPNKEEAWKNLGMVYHNLRLFEDEIKSYDKSLAINPNLIEAISGKATTLFLVYRNPKKALNLFMRLIEIDKEFRYKFEYPYVDFYISECYYSIGNIEKAKHWNNIGLKNNPTDDYFLNQKQRFQ